MSRRGFVLAAVLFALVVLGALGAAGLFAALQEVRAARNTQSQVRARSGAEGALAAVLAGWDVRVLNALAPGDAALVAVPTMPGVAVVAGVKRLNPLLFLVRATASAQGGAELSLVRVVRLDAIEPGAAAARVRGVAPALVGRFDGVDRPPLGWICGAGADTVPALVLQTGAPDSLFFRFGRRGWAQLASWAQAVPSGGDSLAVRYAAGDLELTGGRMLGTVVVEGDLVLRAGAQVVGLALVRGALRLEGAGGRISGSLVASQVVADSSFSGTGEVVTWSSCAAGLAAASRVAPTPLPGALSSLFD